MIIFQKTKVSCRQPNQKCHSCNYATKYHFFTGAAAAEQNLDLATLVDGLQNLRGEIGDAKLTSRTQRLLMINDRADAQVKY